MQATADPTIPVPGAHRTRGLSLRSATSIATATLLVLLAIQPIFAAVVPLIDQVDEGIIAGLLFLIASAGLYAQRSKLSFLAIAAWMFTLIVLSVVFGENRSKVDILMQATIQAKFFTLTAFAVAFVNRRDANRGVLVLFLILLAGAFLNTLIPDVFSTLGASETFRSSFLGLPRVGGFQLNANRLGRTMALVPLLPLAAMHLSRRGAAAVLTVAGVIVWLSGSRTALALFILAMSFRFQASLPSARLRRAAVLFVALPVFAGVTAYGLQEIRISNLGSGALIGEEAPIFRALLLVEGAKLAAERFPFGTGLATFATPFATDVGVYERTALATTFYLNRGTGLFDNNLASILGESGLIGLAFVALLYFMIVDRPLRDQGWLVRLPIMLYIGVILNFESLLQSSVSSAAFALFLAARVRSGGTAATDAAPSSPHHAST